MAVFALEELSKLISCYIWVDSVNSRNISSSFAICHGNSGAAAVVTMSENKNKRRFAARFTVYHEIDQIGYIVQKWPNFLPQYGQRWSNRSL